MLLPTPGARLRQRLFSHRFGAITLFVSLFVLLSFATRLLLIGKASAEISWDSSLLGALLLGAVFDFGAALLFSIPLGLALIALPHGFFRWLPARIGWHLFFYATLALLVFGALSEWVFWDEFGVRFNFIAVDYLVYTQEVIANIRQSYPMPWLLAGVALLAGLTYLGLRSSGWLDRWLLAVHDAAPRGRAPWVWLAAVVTVSLVLDEGRLPKFENNFNREIAKNGVWSLFAAFRANQLEYTQFYPTLSDEEAFARVKKSLVGDGSTALGDDPFDLLRQVQAPRPTEPEQRLNVIQITVESLSAEFLTEFGNREDITPFLDSLTPKSLFFPHFYATGNRTDRGMEALTLSVPPTPGRSLVKRPNNENLFTLGSVFRSKGYATAFVYGGYGYFDNMNYFFGENGYRVVDRNAVSEDDITFANAWGACDEDLFRWTLREADADFAQGRPFFHFVMTTSNHRPFTYPEGAIDLPSKSSGRQGGVKYTDHALAGLLREASTRPWFNQTVFVIVADHCASSAGKSEVPVNRYRIPLWIYAPGGQIAPGRVEVLASQVDFAPTLLGLLNWSYPSRFFGRDVVNHPAKEGRALLGNYQKLALLREGELAILQPVRKSAAYTCDENSGRVEAKPGEEELVRDAIAYYQAASHVFKNQRQGAVKAMTLSANHR